MGRTPVASGSRVPACPALAALKWRRTAATAPADERPAGLSRISQPSTLSPLRVLAIGIAADAGLTQGRVDAAGVIEGGVGHEADIRRAAQLHGLHHLAPDEGCRAMQGRDDLADVAS